LKSVAVMITTPPLSPLTATSLSIVNELVNNDAVQVTGIFFYQDGVLNASASLSMPSDELQAISQWQQLHQAHGLPLHLCITAAEKRGLSDDWQEMNIILPEFTISGLGEFVSLYSEADQVIQL